ncbi:selenoprotein H-like [Sardina pilchardus]|uniref:selenoprotein H-like n=1 Tax=Sardina pilchardus TaxID=27697 RepID=UPI002E149E51
MSARPNSKTGRGSKRKAENHDLKEDAPSLDNKKEKPEDAEIKDEGQKIVIEHSKSCRVYRQHAEAVKSAIQAAHPDMCVELNPQKPRRYSFDISLLDAGKETCLWNGIKMGPPARLKFPDHEELLSILKEALDRGTK